MSREAYFLVQTLGFATGVGLFALLGVLFLQARRAWPGQYPRVLLLAGAATALLCFAWDLSQLCAALASAAGHIELGRFFASKSDACLALLPSTTLWFLVAAARRGPRARCAARWLVRASFAFAGVLAARLLLGEPSAELKNWTAYNQMAHVLLEFPLLFGVWHSSAVRRFARATWWLGLAFMLLIGALIFAPLSGAAERVVEVLTQQSPLLWALISFSLLAPFRFADVFVRRGGLVASAVALAATFQIVAVGPLERWASAHIGGGVPVATVAAWALLLTAFPALARAVGYVVDRWIFRRPDYRALLDELEASIDASSGADEMFAAVRTRLCGALDLHAVFALDLPAADEPFGAGLDDRPRDSTHIAQREQPHVLADGQNVHGWMRLASEGERVRGLAWTAAPGSRALLSAEHEFLDRLAERMARRLQAFVHEDERRGQDRRAAELQQSLVGAELQALRAHIAPHFLFNTLNTIAELIQSQPDEAERMTEQLSATFRYVLSTFECDSIPLADEVRFLEKFLAIERVRFGNRLSVSLEIDPRLEDEPIPPLLLQPLVENAMRHGLAPRVEGGRVSVCAEPTPAGFRVRVEDDGVGFASNGNGCVEGFGFESTRRRVAAFFGAGSRVDVDSQPGGGTRVVLELARVPQSQ